MPGPTLAAEDAPRVAVLVLLKSLRLRYRELLHNEDYQVEEQRAGGDLDRVERESDHLDLPVVARREATTNPRLDQLKAVFKIDELLSVSLFRLSMVGLGRSAALQLLDWAACRCLRSASVPQWLGPDTKIVPYSDQHSQLIMLSRRIDSKGQW